MKRCFAGAFALFALATACSGGDVGGADGAGGTSGSAGTAQSGAAGNKGTSGAGGAGVGGTAGGGGGGVTSQAGKGGGGAPGDGQAGEASHAGDGGTAGAGNTAADGGADGNVSGAEALDPIVKAFCATARACCTNEEDVDLNDCEAQFPLKNEPFASLSRGAVSLDTAGLEACRAAYVAAATSCEMNGVLAACADLVKGKRPDGAACSLGSECAATPGPNTCLITEQGGTVGICKQLPHATVGEECSLTCRKGEDCTFTTNGAADSLLDLCFEDEGLFCDYDLEPAKCQPLRAIGADCTDDDQCGSQSYCDYDDDTCKKRATLGEDCGYCLSSLSCIDGKCKSPPFSAGSACLGYTLGPY